ncbi:SpoIID/LytB domain-containing protein [Nocardia xishanensis]|uniref:SpoIID/LytB domain-containing protein n=1 Tax=Nocardia xishanensis TaxID=238964 RepID=UPI00343353DE
MLVTGCAAVLGGAAAALWSWPGDAPVRPLAAGHGRGMSQVGAFDSAEQGWPAERILEHYYPGATLGTIPPTNLAVRLMEQDGSTLDAYAQAGFRVAGREVAPGHVAHLTPLPNGGANVVVTVGCDGEVLWQTATSDPWIYPLDPKPNRPAAEHLTLCGGNAYRGSLGLATENGEPRTINRVDVEDYLLGVVPAEVQANWVAKGAAEALRAQAIAARSYALGERRYPYAQTCDTTDCQAYPGTAKEDSRTTAVIASTAGTVLLRDGHILRSEYSAAPDGGEPADIYAFEVGPTPAELAVGRPPTDPRPDPRTRAATTLSPIELEYERLGGEASSLGAPLGPEMLLPQRAGTYRLFSNGVIIATPTLGAQVVDFTTLLQLVPEQVIEGGGPMGSAPKPGAAAAPNAASPPTSGAAVPSGPGVGPSAAANVPSGGQPVPSGQTVPGGQTAPGQAVPDGQVVPGGQALADGRAVPGSQAVPGGQAMSGGQVVPGGQALADGRAVPGSQAMSGGQTVPGQAVPDGQVVPGGQTLAGGQAVPGGQAMSGGQVPGGQVVPGAEASVGEAARPGAATSGGTAAGSGGVAAQPGVPNGQAPNAELAIPTLEEVFGHR